MADNRGRGGRGGVGRGGGGGGRGGGGGYQGQGGGRGGGYPGDRGGRGGGYQGDGGGRGGGGGYPGDRGGRGGGYQGDGGGRGGGGGGGYPGDRGGRGGGYRGDRGGRGGGYPGDRGGRGGRGGPRGSGLDVFGQGRAIPDPDGEVTKLEDSFFKSASSTSVNQLTTEMTKLSVTPGIILPVRPAFGTAGTPIVLWANYFALQVKKPQPLFKYGVTVEHVPPPGAVQKPEAKDAKLKKIIQAALRRIPNSGPIATEFKAQVISLKKLDMSDGVVQVEYTEPGRGRIENWNVKFGKPASIHVDELVSYLSHLRDPAGATQFPRYIEEIDALGVILGHQPRDDNQVVTVGRGRFFAIDPDRQEKATQSQDSLLSILRGYYQSVRPATGRLLLNVHVTHGIFRDGGSLRALFENHQVNKMHLALAITGQPWPAEARTMESKLGKLNKFLHKAKARVTVYYNSDRKPRIVTKVLCGIAHKTDKQKPDKETGNKQKGEKGVKQEEVKGPRFTNPQGFPWACPYSTYFYIRAPDKDADRIAGIPYNDYISVAEYYRLRYNKKADPTLPLINYGTKSHPAYTLAELVELEPGQPLKAKLSGQEAQAMISFACRPPADNAISITERARALLHLDGNACIDSFGISVSKDLVTVRGRELPPPVLVYSGKRSVTPEDGGWLMKSIKVFQPGIKINQWVYAYPRDTDAAEIKRTVQDFARFMLNTGIAIEPTPSGSAAYSGAGDFEDALRKTKRSQFVLVVLPRQDTILYNFIKQVCDVGLGIHSVCVVHAKFTSPKGQQGYFANVGLKVNLKMGGVNHSLQNEHKLIASGKTMLVGYDVTHPTNLGPSVIKTDKNGNKTGPPSIVGIVSSIDKHLGQWPAQSWNNRSGVEMLDDKLVEAFEKCLERWETSNNKNPKAPRKPLPENIVIFRDGVSEGQFNTVIETELPHITKACQRKYGKRPMPRISLIVSVKRHQTRFFPTDKNHIHFRSKSPKQGTVVDRGVTNVRFWDFFLQAHASLQGTARPAHYTVLYDEIFRADYKDNAANELEKLTHDMCYLYGRATKAVSICPPAYYADLVCTRSRVHKNELFEDDTPPGSQTGALAQAEDAIRARKVHPNLEHTMYYI